MAERWRHGEAGAEGGQAFAGVAAIMRDVMPDAVRSLERRGAPHYLWRFLSCPDAERPPPSPRIASGGAEAGTEAELATLMRRCMAEIEASGIAPSR